jgi:hypothetical protein
MHAARRTWVDTKPLQTGEVRRHVCLADKHGAHAQRAEMIAQGRLVDAQWEPVPVRPMRAHVPPGVEAHPRRPADRRLHIGAVEPHAACRERVDVRGLQMRVAVAAEVIEPQLVARDE